LPSAFEKGLQFLLKNKQRKIAAAKLFKEKLKLNLVGKIMAVTFALPIKKRAFFKGKK
jgi:hypothetical protein